jgi:hypothetical protein
MYFHDSYLVYLTEKETDMRAFLSYSVAADIFISGFKHGVHIGLRMVEYFFFSLYFYLVFFQLEWLFMR